MGAGGVAEVEAVCDNGEDEDEGGEEKSDDNDEEDDETNDDIDSADEEDNVVVRIEARASFSMSSLHVGQRSAWAMLV